MMLRYRFLLQRTKGIKNEVDIADFNYTQRRSLVNVPPKLIKDRVLDNVVIGQGLIRVTAVLVSIIASDPGHCLPIHDICKHIRFINVPRDLSVATFMRRYPNIFEEVSNRDKVGRPIPWFKLTAKAEELHQEGDTVFQNCYVDVLQRLQKVLMLTRPTVTTLRTLERLKWDLGLPHDYCQTLIPSHPDLFSFVRLPNGRPGLELLKWDQSLAVSHFEMRSVKENENPFAFPIKFARGFGLRRKCMEWLEEWQTLPYTSPYVDASHLDPRTDVSEKRNVAVFHELLHLTIQKKTERDNVRNLRRPLGLPHKYTKVFERHPGIFYISRKGDTQTIVLREAYDHDRLIEKHPLAEIRDKYARLIRIAHLNRKRGLYKEPKEEPRKHVIGKSWATEKIYEPELDSVDDILPEFDFKSE